MEVLQTTSSRNLFPEEIYDLLFKAKLLGEGKVIIRGHYSMSTAPRKGEDGVWRDVKVVDQDSTMDSMTLVPILDVNNRILGDWTIGLTSEEIKRIHEEARVPKYYADNEKHGDSFIKVSHNQVLDLTDPVHMSIFRIIYPNQAIALSKEDMTEDQDYYFYSPVEEKKKKAKDFDVRQAAVDLIAGLAQEAKIEILKLMEHESGLNIPENANEEDKIILFQEQCWDNPKEVLRIFKYKHKEKRLMLYTLVGHNILTSPNFNLTGPYYRPSVNENQEFGDMIGETTAEAIKNLGKTANSDLKRTYDKIVKGTYHKPSALDDIINKTGEEMDAMIEQINVRPAYELPEKITKKWLSKTIKPGLQAYLEKGSVKFNEDATIKDLRALALKHFESE
tara:strand:+ start:1192 stop:2367 length:1176 start_codon:yes stop_codon:yes gene_type:complete